MRKMEKSEAIMGRKYSGGIFHGLKGKPRLFPSLHEVQTLGWVFSSVLKNPENVFFWLPLENTAHCQSVKKKLLVLICSHIPALETSPLLLEEAIFDNSEMGCYLAQNVTKALRAP